MYSLDMRNAAVTAYTKGFGSLRKLACIFDVAPSTISRWAKLPVTAASSERERFGNGLWIRSRFVVNFIADVVQENPFITRRTLRDRIMRVFQFAPSLRLVGTALKRNGFSRVKCRKRFCSRKSPPTVTEYREFSQLFADSENVVSIDETGFCNQYLPMIGYTEKGTRLYVQSPESTRKWVTATVAISTTSEPIIDVRKGAMKGDSFAGFVRSLPFQPGTTLVLDNASIHKTVAVRIAARDKSFVLRFIPAYSPDFNPIENLFGAVRRDVRLENARLGARWSQIAETADMHLRRRGAPSTVKRLFSHTSNLLNTIADTMRTE